MAACTTRACLWLSLLLLPSSLPAQTLTPVDRNKGLVMLQTVKQDLQLAYFDPQFGGLDLQAAYDTAIARVQRATYTGEMLSAIAQVALELHDSHTRFLPGRSDLVVDYGWDMAMVGDTCRVVGIGRRSMARAREVKLGSAVLMVERFQPTAASISLIEYILTELAPRPSLHLVLVPPGDTARKLILEARVTAGLPLRRTFETAEYWQGHHLAPMEHDTGSVAVPVGEAVLYWRLTEFPAKDKELDKVYDQARTRKTLVLDLRDNPGGSEAAYLKLIGGLFEEDVYVARFEGRGTARDLVAPGRGSRQVGGQILVLVNRRTASGAELIARTLQLTGRGLVIGDSTAGQVRQARLFRHRGGPGASSSYATVVSVGDVIMPDGVSLEGTGVGPDEIELPSGPDLAAGRDPVLAHALERAGALVTPEAAAKLGHKADAE